VSIPEIASFCDAAGGREAGTAQRPGVDVVARPSLLALVRRLLLDVSADGRRRGPAAAAAAVARRPLSVRPTRQPLAAGPRRRSPRRPVVVSTAVYP